ncbi:MAG: AraC family transcriptional regulator [Blautia sp.]|nr:AraC family transcriptional regulator [Blautia sp.]MCM1199971.1 AraC family transcriptional regulator [Bacteroides fragilis]
MDIEQNLALLQELFCCGGNIYTWRYDAQGNLLHSNCPHESLFGAAFSFLGCKERALRIGQENGQPQAVGTTFGLLWGVDFLRQEGVLQQMYVIGPVFSHNVSRRDIEAGFRYYAGEEITISWKRRLINAYEEVPLVQHILFTRYLLMLHYCLTGEKLGASDTAVQQSISDAAPADTKRDRHRVWMSEQALLHMVRNGDLNYKDALNDSILISEGVPVKGKDPLRQAKTSVIVFTSIVCRAAIEGGLPPEAAYSLGDFYMQSAENALTYDEIRSIPTLMYDDFIRRVHKARQNPKLSSPVAKCRDYIEMHPGEKIRAKDLAVLTGYTEYYLTRRFREETGLSVSDYVQHAKIERAKVLLRSTELSVQEISEQLRFGSRNYFSRVFSEAEGCTPTQYRKDRE